MGLQFDRIAYSSESSLTLLIDDLARERNFASLQAGAEAAPEMEGWLNALLRQSAPLLQSKAGRANLEAWLDQVESLSAS